MSTETDFVALAETVLASAKADAAGKDGAREDLLNATRKLYNQAEPLPAFATRFRFQQLQNIALMLANEMKLTHTLVKQAPASLTSKDLSKATGYQELLITRLLRLLCVVGIVTETGENTYQANKLTEFMSSRGQESGIQHITELLGPIEATCLKYLHETGFDMFPQDGKPNPFGYGWGKDIWEIFRTDPHHKKNFDDYMAGRRAGVTKQWFETYPAGEELAKTAKDGADGVLLVDVGGNTGYDAYKFGQAHPQLKGKLIAQDLSETMKEAPPLEGVELQPHDFFQEQPVKGAQAYFFRAVFHDWSDHESMKILKRTVDAMDKDYSKVLIADVVLPPTGAPIRSTSLDVLMMLFASGIERTPRHWDELLTSAGLKIVKIWYPTDGMECVIEAVKA